MILWNNENDLFEFVKPPSIESLFYGDIEGSTCYSGELKASCFRANGSYNCRLRRHKRMEYDFSTLFSPKDTLSKYERYYGMILNMKRNHLSHGPQPRYISLSMNRSDLKLAIMTQN